MNYKTALILLLLVILSCSHNAVREEIRNGKITVFVQADIILETEEMNMDELKAYMIQKGQKRASSLLTAEYLLKNRKELSQYRELDLSPCLKDSSILYLDESRETVDCSVSFRLDRCDEKIESKLSEYYEQQ